MFAYYTYINFVSCPRLDVFILNMSLFPRSNVSSCLHKNEKDLKCLPFLLFIKGYKRFE